MRIPIRFDPWYRTLSSALLVPPSASFVDVGDDDVEVRMGWAFRARFARSAVASAAPYSGQPIARGVHGWAGRWLVNGAGDRVLAIDLEPPARAYVMGLPVRLRRLLVSLDDPGALAAQLQRA